METLPSNAPVGNTQLALEDSSGTRLAIEEDSSRKRLALEDNALLAIEATPKKAINQGS